MALVAFIDIARFAYNAGFRDTPLRTAIAITVPESGRDSKATHLNTNGTTDYGLWQINSVHLQPGGLLAGWSVDDLLDPAKNAVAAFLVWKAQSFAAWATYTNGLHEPSLDAASVAADARNRLSVKDSVIELCQNQITDLQNQNTVLQNEVAALQAQDTVLQSQLAAAQAKIDKARADLS